MARRNSTISRKHARPGAAPYLGDIVVTHRYCAARFPRMPGARPGVQGNRLRLIRETAFKWLNGTTITYGFYDRPAWWKADERRAFALWKSLGIGLEFAELAHARDADVRIAFDQTDGSWSYVGTDMLNQPLEPRDDLPQHHREDRAGHGCRLELGPEFGDALSLRCRADPAAGPLPARAHAQGRAVGPGPQVGAALLSADQGEKGQETYWTGGIFACLTTRPHLATSELR